MKNENKWPTVGDSPVSVTLEGRNTQRKLDKNGWSTAVAGGRLQTTCPKGDQLIGGSLREKHDGQPVGLQPRILFLFERFAGIHGGCSSRREHRNPRIRPERALGADGYGLRTAFAVCCRFLAEIQGRRMKAATGWLLAPIGGKRLAHALNLAGR